MLAENTCSQLKSSFSALYSLQINHNKVYAHFIHEIPVNTVEKAIVKGGATINFAGFGDTGSLTIYVASVLILHLNNILYSIILNYYLFS